MRPLPRCGGEEVGGLDWGGGCLRQEDQMGQGRVEVKGGGRGPTLGGSRTGGEQICVCLCVFCVCSCPRCVQMFH